MKIITIVGARPQFIKAAMVSDQLRKRHTEILVHTGQHYDYNMSDQFFVELGMSAPKYNLGISGGSHATMTGKMMIAIESVLLKENPDWVLVYGDTNTTLAAALTAAKIHIPVCHVEAGVRTKSRTNPEEINRICTDNLSTLLLASTKNGVDNLIKEGFDNNCFFVGDLMYDAFLKYSAEITEPFIVESLHGGRLELPNEYYYLTCHREENTRNDSSLQQIFQAMECLDAMTVYPVHPRNKERAQRLIEKNKYRKILLIEPVGYLESMYLVKNSKKIVTDSGGLQREAFFAKKKCVTILDFECWPETMLGNRNDLAHPNRNEILDKLSKEQKIDESYIPFGNGHSAEKIISLMEEFKLKRGEIM